MHAGTFFLFASAYWALLPLIATRPSRALEVVVLVSANAAATLARFLLLRGWVFHPRRSRPVDDAPPTGRLPA